MKVRHLKHRAIAAMLAALWSDAYWQAKIDKMMEPTPEDIERSRLEREAFWEKLRADLAHFKDPHGPLDGAVKQLGDFLIRTPEESHALFSVEEVEAAKVEYVVAKVSTGEVVDTFDLKEDALALINKHHKQKKARLYLLGDHPPEVCTEHDVG